MSVLSGALHQTQHTQISLCKNVEFWCGASRSTKKYQHTISCAALCAQGRDRAVEGGQRQASETGTTTESWEPTSSTVDTFWES